MTCDKCNMTLNEFYNKKELKIHVEKFLKKEKMIILILFLKDMILI